MTTIKQGNVLARKHITELRPSIALPIYGKELLLFLPPVILIIRQAEHGTIQLPGMGKPVLQVIAIRDFPCLSIPFLLSHAQDIPCSIIRDNGRTSDIICLILHALFHHPVPFIIVPADMIAFRRYDACPVAVCIIGISGDCRVRRP